MRKDMAKVIVERPRIGGRFKFPRGKQRYRKPRDADDDIGLPSFEGIRKPWTVSGGGKCLNENLAPLRRFLQSRVGQPWNEVYSEIRANLRVDSAVQLHVIQHLEDYVETNVRLIDGEPYTIQRRGWEPITESNWWTLFYVHPETVLLMKAPKSKRSRWYRPSQPRGCPYERVTTGRMTRAFKIEGYWYELALTPICKRHATHDGRVDVQDVLLPALSRPHEHWDYYGGPCYAVKKRQMSSRAIRQLIAEQAIIKAGHQDPSFANSGRYPRFRKQFKTWANDNYWTRRKDASPTPPYPNWQRGPAQTRSGAGSNPAGGIPT